MGNLWKKGALLLVGFLAGTYAAFAQSFTPGFGKEIFTGYAPLANKPVEVYYYIPEEGDIETMPILFAFHGAGRDGKEQAIFWQPFAAEGKFIVLSLTYPNEYYPIWAYQFGGVTNEVGDVRPEEKWTYQTVEAIFDWFRKATGNRSRTYDMWGHSAGGQFVHRFLAAMPKARVNRAVASNPGSWTFPLANGLVDTSGNVYGWPFSLKDLPFSSKKAMKCYFGRNMVVHLGTSDTSSTTRSLPREPGSMAQGKCRFDRGHACFEAAKREAERLGVPFRWTLVEVPGVAHDARGMILGRSSKTVTKKTYIPENALPVGAYELLYGGDQQ